MFKGEENEEDRSGDQGSNESKQRTERGNRAGTRQIQETET